MRNEYENEAFFQQYAQMSRSREGLSAAGEWHQLKPLFPPLEGKSVLDLGCGYGWHCKFAVEQGARQVLGIDLSQKMIEEAKRRNSGEGILYQVCGIEEYEYPEAAWDCVVSNLALHYIEDLDSIFEKVHQTLKKDGIFLFNIEHPVLPPVWARIGPMVKMARHCIGPSISISCPGSESPTFWAARSASSTILSPRS